MSVYIIDTETTGVVDPVPVELSWLSIDCLLTITDQFDRRYRPGKPISFGAMGTHHIIESDLVECPLFSDFKLPEDCQFLIGHNVDFDWLALGKPDVKRICTLALSRSLWPEADSHTLGAMMYALTPESGHEDLRRDIKNAHSSLTDAIMTLNLLRYIISKLRIFRPIDFNELWEASELARIPKIMSFGKHKGLPVKQVPEDYRRWYRNQPDTDPYLIKAWEA